MLAKIKQLEDRLGASVKDKQAAEAQVAHTHTQARTHKHAYTNIFSIMNTSAQSNIRTHTLEHTHSLYQVTTLRGTLEQVQKSLEAEIVDLRDTMRRSGG